MLIVDNSRTGGSSQRRSLGGDERLLSTIRSDLRDFNRPTLQSRSPTLSFELVTLIEANRRPRSSIQGEKK